MPSEHVAVCECDWAVSTRGDAIDRDGVEAVAEIHAGRCGPVELREVYDPQSTVPLAQEDGETLSAIGRTA